MMATESAEGPRRGKATLTTPYEEGVPQTAVLTAYYFGGAYEVTGSDVRKYYSFGGQTILRDSTGLQYFLTDHLGSVVAITDSNGTLTSQQRYLPFGAERTDIGTIAQTDYGYTGQRDLGMGLMDYKARLYSPLVGRFVQPDTLIPNPSNPQVWNRYSYVNNRPINFNDPTGHRPCGDVEALDCDGNPNNLGIRTRSNGGGGGDDDDEPTDDVAGRQCGYHPCEVANLYQTGWENFGQAWSISTNPNASYGQRFVAGTYMSYWGGAHAMLVAGGAMLLWEVLGTIALGASADGDPTNEIRAFYRGDDVGLKSMVSKAGQISMDYARSLLAKGDLSKIMADHARNSSSPPSPFVSVTTDPRVAELWAELGGGRVYQIMTNRAILNPSGIPGESEWLVPLEILASEIVK